MTTQIVDVKLPLMLEHNFVLGAFLGIVAGHMSFSHRENRHIRVALGEIFLDMLTAAKELESTGSQSGELAARFTIHPEKLEIMLTGPKEYRRDLNRSDEQASQVRLIETLVDEVEFGTDSHGNAVVRMVKYKPASMGGVASLGSGKYTYDVAEGWLKLPSGIELGGLISSVDTDSKGRVFVSRRTTKGPFILIFDREGNFLDGWGDALISDSHHMCISPRDEVFVVDRNHHLVMKFTLDGKLLLTLGTRDTPGRETPFNRPTGVRVGPSGNIYVSDGYTNSRVHKFTPKGDLITSWGTPGDGPGQFSKPHGIWVDTNERVYVCDQDNFRIQVFDSDGRYITEWVDFLRPTDICMDAEGTVYVSGTGQRVSILRHDGQLITRWGGQPLDVNRSMGLSPFEHGDREEAMAHSLCVDSSGDIYLAGAPMSRLQKYVRRR